MAVFAVLALLGRSAAGRQGTPPALVSDGAERIIETWAPPGMTRNPVSICFDPRGNLYVAESDRAGNAVQDTRQLGHLHAVEEDLRMGSVEDRRSQIRRWIAAGAFPADYFTRTEDRVRVLSDADGDGVADRAGVFAGGFNGELDGIAAGVLWLEGTLYFTCIPDLWALRDTSGDLEADERESLAHGFGVRWCFFGHDLHGLTPGPDGRLYFSMGDRGYNVGIKEGGRLVGTDRGAVFRCWPDGSGLELVHDGLRNPQELAFDELGDLFTGDNNCDSGDRARLVQIVEGGDSGWRQDVQSLDSRGPWNREAMWKTLEDVKGEKGERPAWSLPPAAYLGAGPSGLALYPGTGESRAYDGRLFLVDFYGSGATVHAFRCVPDGAGFALADHVEYYKGATITDIAWGYDGRLYMSDWGGGWSPNPNGNVVTVTNRTVHGDAAEKAAIDEVATICGAGFGARADEDLIAMLRHRDQRVRLGAQYELATRGGSATDGLGVLAGDGNAPIVARAHAVWGLGQIARRVPEAALRLMPLLDDRNAEVRVQALRTLGDLRPSDEEGKGLAGACIGLLDHPSARVRLAAATAVGKVGDARAVGPLLGMLTKEGGEGADPVLRHGWSYALSRIAEPGELVRQAAGMNAPARLGAVVALRWMGDERVAGFLHDADGAVAIEAARAVYDLRLASGLPALAALLDTAVPADRAIEPLLRRAVEANVLLGTDECAARLAAFAGRAGVEAPWRRLALERLYGWDRALDREAVWGNWVGLPARPTDSVQRAVQAHVESILGAAAGDDELLGLAYRLQVRHALRLAPEEMAAQATDAARPEIYRLALLEQLAADAPDRVARASEAVLAPGSRARGPLRRRAQALLAAADPAVAAGVLRDEVSKGGSDPGDRQHAVRLLGSIDEQEARETIAAMVRDLRRRSLDRAVALDVYEAAMALPPGSRTRAAAASAGVEGDRPPGYATALLAAGGDATAGLDIFLHHRAAECLRCHAVNGSGGTAAGPDLSRVGDRLGLDRLVESIVEPRAVVADGFGTVSAMPEMTAILRPREVRDVVAFLATLKEWSPGVAVTPEDPGRRALPGRLLGLLLALPLLGVVWRGMTRRV